MIKPNKKVMKKVSYLFAMMAVVGTLFVTSCKKEDPIPPTVTFDPSSTVDATTNSSFTVTINITAGDAELSSLTIFDANFGGDSSVVLSGTSDVYTYEGTVSGTYADSVGIITVDVTDIDGQTSSADITVNVTSGAPSTRECVDHRLGAQNAVAGSFYSSEQDSVYSTSNAKANPSVIDISFMEKIATGDPILVSPDYRDEEGSTNPFPDSTLAGARVTYFSSTTLDPATASDSDIDAISIDETVVTNKSISVSNGTSYAFINDAGKKGLLKVTNYAAGTTFSGELTLTVRIQE